MSGVIYLQQNTARDRLTASRIYYVRTDGNDANTGLTDSSGGAFLTWQAAINTVFALDWSIYDVTIKAGGTGARAWTLTSANRLIIPNSAVGSGRLILEGDTTTPTNVQLNSVENISFITNTCNTNSVEIKGFHFIQNANQTGTVFLKHEGSGLSIIDFCDFGRLSTGAANNQAHILVNRGLVDFKNGTISGGNGYCHFWMRDRGGFIRSGGTVTLTGTPAFSVFAYIANGAATGWFAPTAIYTGAATGRRYEIAGGGITLQSGSTSYFPGNVAGTLQASPSSYYLTF